MPRPWWLLGIREPPFVGAATCTLTMTLTVTTPHHHVLLQQRSCISHAARDQKHEDPPTIPLTWVRLRRHLCRPTQTVRGVWGWRTVREGEGEGEGEGE